MIRFCGLWALADYLQQGGLYYSSAQCPSVMSPMWYDSMQTPQKLAHTLGSDGRQQSYRAGLGGCMHLVVAGLHMLVQESRGCGCTKASAGSCMRTT